MSEMLASFKIRYQKSTVSIFDSLNRLKFFINLKKANPPYDKGER